MDICPRVLVYEKGHFVSVALIPSPQVVLTPVLSASKPCPWIHPRERSAFPDASQPFRTDGASGSRHAGAVALWPLAGSAAPGAQGSDSSGLGLAPLFSSGLSRAELQGQSCIAPAPHVVIHRLLLLRFFWLMRNQRSISMSSLVITVFNVFLSRMSMLTHKWEFQTAEYSL